MNKLNNVLQHPSPGMSAPGMAAAAPRTVMPSSIEPRSQQVVQTDEEEMRQAQALIDNLLSEKQATIELMRACQLELETRLASQVEVAAQQARVIGEQATEIQQLKAQLARRDDERTQIEVQIGKYIVESQDRIAELERRLTSERQLNMVLANSHGVIAGSSPPQTSVVVPPSSTLAPSSAPALPWRDERVQHQSSKGATASPPLPQLPASNGGLETQRATKRSPQRGAGLSMPHRHGASGAHVASNGVSTSMAMNNGYTSLVEAVYQPQSASVEAPSPRSRENSPLRRSHHTRRSIAADNQRHMHGTRSSRSPPMGSAAAEVAALQLQLQSLSAATSSIVHPQRR